MSNLEKYGVSERFMTEAALYPEYAIGRIISQYKDYYRVATEQGEYFAEVSGKFRHEAGCISDFPAIGDFVMLDRANGENGNLIIHKVLTRKSSFERKAIGVSNQVQVVAANVDLVFICMSLNNDYNLSRLERYLSVAWNSRAKPIVVLTKSDLCKNVAEVLEEISTVAIGTETIVTSVNDKDSCMEILSHLGKGVTASFIGSSGVGKSTLVNCLAGKEVFSTSGLRNDDKGRHTTTRRELVILPQGGIVIDTPGMREIGLDSVDLSKSFSDIDALASQCKFRDCKHDGEPGCAVHKALENGELEERRYENYKKLKKEAKYDGLNSKQIETAKYNEMFGEFGGMKKARAYIRQKNKRK